MSIVASFKNLNESVFWNKEFQEAEMGLTMKERRKIATEVAGRYQRASKKGKGVMLEEFVQVTGYNRTYASHLLHCHGKVVRLGGLRMIFDAGRTSTRERPRRYGTAVHEALRKIWAIMDFICGKRLAPIMEEIVTKLQRHNEITVDDATKQKLLRISASSIDRLLASDRKKMMIKGRHNTRPGTLLKHQVPIRTFSDWNETRPGFVEVDLVGHDGGNSAGEYLQTLDVTDVSTGWTETQAVKTKAQIWVFEALREIRDRLPFELLGIDSDNGSEFINTHLIRYCITNRISFTRSRPNRKNDNCFVEQKNYSVVRRAVGYGRHTTQQEQAVMNELYRYLRPYTNFFQPVMKLREKARNGSSVTRRYDVAKTPYQRVLESPFINPEVKERLRIQYLQLNPAELKRSIIKLQEMLTRLGVKNSFTRCESLPPKRKSPFGNFRLSPVMKNLPKWG